MNHLSDKLLPETFATKSCACPFKFIEFVLRRFARIFNFFYDVLRFIACEDLFSIRYQIKKKCIFAVVFMVTFHLNPQYRKGTFRPVEDNFTEGHEGTQTKK